MAGDTSTSEQLLLSDRNHEDEGRKDYRSRARSRSLALLWALALFVSGCAETTAKTGNEVKHSETGKLQAATTTTTTQLQVESPHFPLACSSIITSTKVSELVGRVVAFVPDMEQDNSNSSLCDFDSFNNDQNDLYVAVDADPSDYSSLYKANTSSAHPSLTQVEGLGSSVSASSNQYGSRVVAFYGSWLIDVNEQANNSGEGYTLDQILSIARVVYANVTNSVTASNTGGG